MLKKFLFIFLMLPAFSVFADTYPKVAIPNIAICQTTLTGILTGGSCQSLGYDAGQWGGEKFKQLNSSGTWIGSMFVTYTTYDCPSGGTLSGSNCINAPVCVSPQQRNGNSPYQCFTPVECAYPETDNGSGVCANNTCPGVQTRNPTTKQCQTPPTCATTEAYDIYANTCYLKKLACPGNTHANSANDICLPNAPLVCSAGQHDDGSYQCVADASPQCSLNQTYGKINGISQCISKANPEQKGNDLAQATLDTTLAKGVLDNANTALAADPTNPIKQAAQIAAQTSYTETKTTSDQKQRDLDSELLGSIDQTLKGEGPAGTSQDLTALTSMDTQASTNFSNTGTGFLSDVVILPSSSTCQTIPMNYKSLSYTFDPCGKLVTFREMFGYMLYVLTAYGIYQIALRPGV